MTKQTIRDLVPEINCQTSDLSAYMIDLKVVQGAVSQLMQRIDEITYKKFHEEPTMARISINEIKDTVRLIDMAFNPLCQSLDKRVDELESHSSELFDIVVRQEDSGTKKD